MSININGWFSVPCPLDDQCGLTWWASWKRSKISHSWAVWYCFRTTNPSRRGWILRAQSWQWTMNFLSCSRTNRMSNTSTCRTRKYQFFSDHMTTIISMCDYVIKQYMYKDQLTCQTLLQNLNSIWAIIFGRKYLLAQNYVHNEFALFLTSQSLQ